MEWLTDRLIRWFDPAVADKRKVVKALQRSVDDIIKCIYSKPQVLVQEEVYHFNLPKPHEFSSVREVYWGFPSIHEIVVGRSDLGDRINAVLHSPYQSWVAELVYYRSNHASKIISPRTIDFSDEALRLKMIKEALEVVQVNHSIAQVVRAPMIP